jgi:hypothetical protein
MSTLRVVPPSAISVKIETTKKPAAKFFALARQSLDDATMPEICLTSQMLFVAFVFEFRARSTRQAEQEPNCRLERGRSGARRGCRDSRFASGQVIEKMEAGTEAGQVKTPNLRNDRRTSGC